MGASAGKESSWRLCGDSVADVPGSDRVLRAALEEDLGPAGDVTTRSLVPEDRLARATVLAEEPLVLAGLDVAVRAFTLLDPSARRISGARDGEDAQAGQAVLQVEGRAQALLTAERTALNLLGRLCGIATTTSRVVRRLVALLRSSTRARPRPACAISRSTPCAAAAGRTTVRDCMTWR